MLNIMRIMMEMIVIFKKRNDKYQVMMAIMVYLKNPGQQYVKKFAQEISQVLKLIQGFSALPLCPENPYSVQLCRSICLLNPVQSKIDERFSGRGRVFYLCCRVKQEGRMLCFSNTQGIQVLPEADPSVQSTSWLLANFKPIV